MKIGRVFYLAPVVDTPCGGILINILHCKILRENGIEAYPLFEKRVSFNWISEDLEILCYDDVGYQLERNDIVVASEVLPYEALKFKNAIKVMFIQNHFFSEVSSYYPRFYMVRKFFQKNKPGGFKRKHKNKDYQKLGYDYVITISDFLRDFLKEKMNIEPYVINNGIDLSKFVYRSEYIVKNRILCLPRKNKDDIEAIREIVDKDDLDIEWLYADNLPQIELIKEYQKADIFLATGYPEGFGLPPLEAMACGCVVVGFTGGGASSFMRHNETALVSEDGDCEDAARNLTYLLKNDSVKQELRDRGLNESRDFGLENMEEDLLNFYRNVVKG